MEVRLEPRLKVVWLAHVSEVEKADLHHQAIGQCCNEWRNDGAAVLAARRRAGSDTSLAV